MVKRDFLLSGAYKGREEICRGLFARHSAFGTETIDSLNFYREICHFLERKKEKMESASKDPIFRLLLLLLLSSLSLFRFDFRSSASGKLIRPFLFRGNERVGGSISRLDIDSGFLESRNTNEEKREREREGRVTNVFFAAAVHTSNIYPKIQRSGKLRVGIKEGGISFSLSPDSFERRCSGRRSRGQTPGFSTAPVFD